MSLLTRGPHKVEVTPMTLGRDSLGRTLVPGTPVMLDGVMVQPSTMAEDQVLAGGVAASCYKVLGRGPWPGGLHSRVRVIKGPPGTEGFVFDQQGEPKTRSVSPRTAGFSVMIKKRSAEVK